MIKTALTALVMIAVTVAIGQAAQGPPAPVPPPCPIVDRGLR